MSVQKAITWVSHAIDETSKEPESNIKTIALSELRSTLEILKRLLFVTQKNLIQHQNDEKIPSSRPGQHDSEA